MGAFKGLGSWTASYKYRLDKLRLADYPMEQQASIVADYFYLKTYGENEFLKLAGRELIGIVDKNTLAKYEPIIRSAGLKI